MSNFTGRVYNLVNIRANIEKGEIEESLLACRKQLETYLFGHGYHHTNNDLKLLLAVVRAHIRDPINGVQQYLTDWVESTDETSKTE